MPNVRRIEQSKNSQLIHEYKGPILDYSCDHICDHCQQQLQKEKVPKNALENGLWLGAVPEELSCLRFIEKLLIAQVHINSCFIQVASYGLQKIASHVIAFKSPVPSVSPPSSTNGGS